MVAKKKVKKKAKKRGRPPKKKVAKKKPKKRVSARAKANAIDQGGRPTEYTGEAHDDLAYKLCLLGADNEKTADALGISTGTLHAWKAKHPTFLSAIKRGKAPADAEVAHSLYRRACGYSHPETKFMTVSLGGNGGSQVEQFETIRHYPPDTAACFIWLKNRAGWKDKQELAVELEQKLSDFVGWHNERVKKHGGHNEAR